jgi:uncharacterized damage-inducible protein DinB
MVKTASTLQIANATLAVLQKDYAQYNLWANKRLVDWLRTKPVELLDQEVPSSFPSLTLTLLHIWDVQRTWLAFVKGESAPSSFRLNGFDGTPEDVMIGIISHSQEIVDYISGLDDTDLTEDCKFLAPVRWPEWDEFERPRFQLIQHCLTHSVYHRGQVVTIGRNVGLTDAPMTDYMYYLLLGKEEGSKQAA